MNTYDRIGSNYALHRKADDRIVETAYGLLNLQKGFTIADIGAGSGNYSHAMGDKGLIVFAIEPSSEMTSQRIPHPNVKWVRGTAEQMPISKQSVDGILVMCALHHFKSLERAANEFDRICRSGPIVILTFDPRESEDFWLNDYFPTIWRDAYFCFGRIDSVSEIIAHDNWHYEVIPFHLPHDLSDRFMGACWRFPELYLDETVRNSMSAFALAKRNVVEDGVNKLKSDLESGFWDEAYGLIRGRTVIDLGYRFLKFERK